MLSSAAVVLAVLGAIDSLLTSLVADSLTSDFHDSDKELRGTDRLAPLPSLMYSTQALAGIPNLTAADHPHSAMHQVRALAMRCRGCLAEWRGRGRLCGRW